MKQKIQILFLAVALFLGNKTDGQVNFTSVDSVIHYLTGQWEWVRTTGGFFGSALPITPQSRGYTMRYEFSRIEGKTDSIVYSFYKNDTLQWTKNAGLLFGKSPWGYTWNLTKLFGSLNFYNVTVFELSNDSLSFADTAYDGYRHQFGRKKKENLSGTPTLFSSGIKIYPNPCQTSFRVNFGGQPGFDYLRLSNLNGQTVKELANGDDVVDVSGIVPGVYILNAIKGKQQVREKLIIR